MYFKKLHVAVLQTVLWLQAYFTDRLLTMYSREQACTKIVVQIFILTHFKHFLPLLHSHLVLNALSCLLLISELFSSKLRGRRQEKNSSIKIVKIMRKRRNITTNKIHPGRSKSVDCKGLKKKNNTKQYGSMIPKSLSFVQWFINNKKSYHHCFALLSKLNPDAQRWAIIKW